MSFQDPIMGMMLLDSGLFVLFPHEARTIVNARKKSSFYIVVLFDDRVSGW
jgi:hypothetical protein